MKNSPPASLQALIVAARCSSKEKSHLLFGSDLLSPNATQGFGEHSLDPLEVLDLSPLLLDSNDGNFGALSNEPFNWGSYVSSNHNPLESSDTTVNTFIDEYHWATISTTTPLIPSLSIEEYDPLSPSVWVQPPDLSPRNYLYPIVSPGTILTFPEGEYGPVHFSGGSDCSTVDGQYGQDSEGSLSVNEYQSEDIETQLLCALVDGLPDFRIFPSDFVIAEHSLNTGLPLTVDLSPSHENRIVDCPSNREKGSRKSSKQTASISTRRLVSQIRAMNLNDSRSASSSTEQSQGESPTVDTVSKIRVTPTGDKLFYRSVGTQNIWLASQARRSETSIAKFKCKICPRTFTTKHNIEYHERAHSGEKPFKCDNCPAAFGSPSDRKRHMSKRTSCRHPRHSSK